MQISISNAIESLSRGGGRIIQFGLQLWLDFIKSDVIGSDVIKLDFNSDWVDSGALVVDDSNSFTTTGDGTIKLNTVTTVGSVYDVVFSGTTTTVGFFRLRSYDGATTYFTHQTGGAFSGSFQITASTEGFRIRANAAGVTNITTFTVKEVTQFVMDKSPNTNNAKLFTGKALSFNGDDSVDIGGTLGLSGAFSIAFWVNLTNYTEAVIVGDSANEDWFRINSATNYTLKLNLSTSTIDFGGSIPLDTWKRVVLIRNSSDLVTLAVDGIIYTDNAPTRIGDFDFTLLGEKNGTFMSGLLSDVQVYNKAWTEPDVAFDYNNPNHLAIDNPDTSLVVTDLKAYWALSEGDGLVAYDSGSTLEEDVVQNGDFSELGVEELIDGDFPNGSTDWYDGSGGTIVNNQMVLDCEAITNANTFQTKATAYTLGKTYQVTATIASNTTGKPLILYPYSSSPNTSVITVGETAGTYTIYFVSDYTSGSGKTFALRSLSSTGVLVIDNISVKQVDPNDEWNLGTGWSYGDDKAVSDGTTSNLFQVLEDGNVIGRTYQISLLVSNYTSGYLVTSVGGYDYSPNQISSNGAHTVIVKVTNASSNDRVYLGSTLFNGSVTNITVTEITPSDHGGINSGATYVDKQPTIPQLGMMDWAKGSNLITYSQNFAEWSVFDDVSTVANYGVSPDGTQNSFKVSSLGGGNDFTYLSLTITASQTFTVSFFIKNIDCLKSVFWNPSESQIEIDWNGATISSIGTGANFESVGNGWWRIAIEGDPSSAAYDSFTIASSLGGTTYTDANYQGDGTSGIYVAMPQLEQGSSVTSYIPTNGSIIQRAAETCNDSGNSEVFNDSQGVLFADIADFGSGINVISLNTGNNTQKIMLYLLDGNKIRYYIQGSGGFFSADIAVTSTNNFSKILIKYKQNDFSLWVNGFEVDVNTSSITFDNLSSIDFYNPYGGGVDNFYGKTKEIAYYDTALTDEELETLTSYRSLNEMVTELNLNAL